VVQAVRQLQLMIQRKLLATMAAQLLLALYVLQLADWQACLTLVAQHKIDCYLRQLVQVYKIKAARVQMVAQRVLELLGL
jgi:D-arabinose 1-dehydrogenase-like Zn-dependent alcohol dehydrogenase